jgi:hypothetical protein
MKHRGKLHNLKDSTESALKEQSSQIISKLKRLCALCSLRAELLLEMAVSSPGR